MAERKEILDSIVSVLKEKKYCIFLDDLGPSTSLSELGLDSLDMVELVMELEQKHKIAIPDETLFNVETLEDLIFAIDCCLTNNS